MKKPIIILAFLLLFAGILSAVEVTIGLGTTYNSTSGSPAVYSGYYKNNREQYLITPGELNAAGGGGGSITSIAFNVQALNGVGARPMVIKMGHTASTAFTTTLITGLTPVKTYTTYTPTLGWNVHGLDTAFPWNGTQSLVVEVFYGDLAQAYTNNASTYFTSTTPVNTALYFRSDTTDANSATNGTQSTNRPNMKFDMAAYVPAAPGPAALVSPLDTATLVARAATLNWAAGAGIPTGYKLYFGTDNGDLPGNTWEVGPLDVLNTFSYDPYGTGNMAYGDTYFWKIVPYNGIGDCTTAPVWSFTIVPDPTQPLPYTQNFNSGTSLSAINWTGTMYISSTHGNSGTNGLYRNLYSSVTTANAVSCPIGPMVANAELDFDYRIVDYSGYPATGTTLSATDKIEVQISTDGGLTFPNTIYTINSSNHVTSNAFASLVVPLDDYSTGNIFVKLLCTWGAGDYYVDIDNVVVRQTPAAGVLTVSPNPVACGNGYVGFNKNVQVSLTNTGVAPFAISLGGITLSDNTHFGLSGLPTLPKTINPGDPAVTFNVVFHPTVAGDLSTNLLINDTRLNSSIVVNGTGVVMPVGEICENPYLATLPLVNYAGTTLGYANDYTSAMFTGLGSTYYVGGLDWVTKFTIPESGWLDVNLTNPTGDTANYYPGIFLVNTIPSLASPAAVLAQAYASTAPINITDAELTAGDYYLIVDNWPSPATINFVLNMSFQPLPSGPVVAPNLDNPADGAPNMPLGGFPFYFSWNTSGSEPEAYNLYIAAVNDLSASYDADEFFSVATAYDNVASPYTPAFTYAYGAHYVWTVGGYNTAYPDPVFTWPPYEFVIEPAPLIISAIPYCNDFETHGDNTLPEGWGRSTLGTGWLISADYSSTYFTIPAHTVYAAANDDAANDDGSMDLLTMPLLNLSSYTAAELKFDSYYNGDYSEVATVEITTNSGGTWSTLYTVPANDAWTTYLVPLTSYMATPFQLRFHADDNGSWASGWAIDNVCVREILDYDAAPLTIDIPQVVPVASFTPTATVTNLGTQTISFTVVMTIGGVTLPTQSVTGLAYGATQQVSFGSFLPVVNTFYDVSVTTYLTGDENPANDVITGGFFCLPLDKTAYADAAYDPGAVLDGPATFNLQTPGIITDLTAASPYPTQFLAGADWIDCGWWGAEYYDSTEPTSGSWWEINTEDGVGTDNGDIGINLTGVAWDPAADIVYGTDGTSLYTVNKLTGAPTLIGGLTWDSEAFAGLFIDLAWNNLNSTLYGLCIQYNAVFTIDPVTLAVTPLGYTTGYDLSYAQGMAFDQSTGNLYLAAYAGVGALMWVNLTPDADELCGDTYVVGTFQNGAEMDGFVIPYNDSPAPVVSIAVPGTLTWTAVDGAVTYSIYASDDPYGTFTWVADVLAPNLTWTDPLFPEVRKFYKVTSDCRSTGSMAQINGIDRLRMVTTPTRVQATRSNRQIVPKSGAFSPFK